MKKTYSAPTTSMLQMAGQQIMAVSFGVDPSTPIEYTTGE